MCEDKPNKMLNYGAFKNWLLGAIVMMVGVCVMFIVVMRNCYPDIAERGQFGDQFGALNALFSGLAFFGLIIALLLQSRDLTAQTKSLTLQNEALRLQIDEFKAQKDEMAKAANAQIEMIKVEKVKLSMEVEKANLNFINSIYSGQERGTNVNYRGQRLPIKTHFEAITGRMEELLNSLQ